MSRFEIVQRQLAATHYARTSSLRPPKACESNYYLHSIYGTGGRPANNVYESSASAPPQMAAPRPSLEMCQRQRFSGAATVIVEETAAGGETPLAQRQLGDGRGTEPEETDAAAVYYSNADELRRGDDDCSRP